MSLCLASLAHHNAGVAQLVEQHVANVQVAGSSPVSRFRGGGGSIQLSAPTAYLAPWPSGKAEDCKSFIPSSNLGGASGEMFQVG
jgi:hypothetical protein